MITWVKWEITETSRRFYFYVYFDNKTNRNTEYNINIPVTSFILTHKNPGQSPVLKEKPDKHWSLSASFSAIHQG